MRKGWFGLPKSSFGRCKVVTKDSSNQTPPCILGSMVSSLMGLPNPAWVSSRKSCFPHGCYHHLAITILLSGALKVVTSTDTSSCITMRWRLTLVVTHAPTTRLASTLLQHDSYAHRTQTRPLTLLMPCFSFQNLRLGGVKSTFHLLFTHPKSSFGMGELDTESTDTDKCMHPKRRFCKVGRTF
jgi:hypothetical protein